MARIFFMAFEAAGQTPLVKKLRAAGHKVVLSEPRHPEFLSMVRQQQPPPQVFLVECGHRPSHAREACNYLKGLGAYRNVPFILFNVRAEDSEQTRAKVPGAILIANAAVENEIEKLGLSGRDPSH